MSVAFLSGCSQPKVPRKPNGKCADLAGFGFPLMVPEPETTIFVCNDGFAVQYNTASNNVLWSTEHLTEEKIRGDYRPIANMFRPDHSLMKAGVVIEKGDYQNFVFSLGQLSPWTNFASKKDMMSESFFLSNVAPMNKVLIDGSWSDLNNSIQRLALKEKSLYIITGPIFAGGYSVVKINNKVTIPTHFYKVILSTKTSKVYAFIVPNKAYKHTDLAKFATSLEQVERITAIHFFTTLQKGLIVRNEKNILPE